MTFFIYLYHDVSGNKKASLQQAVWRQSGCMLAESSVGIWKFVARSNFSVPPPERQAAATLCVSAESVVEKVFRLENVVQLDNVVRKDKYLEKEVRPENAVYKEK